MLELKLDPKTNRVEIDGKKIRLTTKEFVLLEYLMHFPGEVVTRREILDHLWKTDFNPFSNIIDSHIKNLRRKLKFRNREYIETVRGVGYKIMNY